MTIHLNTQADLDRAVTALVKQDPRLAPILDLTGMPALRRREPGFAGLAHIVCGQQVSTASAAAIWGRVSAAFDPFHHDALRKARADRLGRLGLSGAKIKTLKNLARELAAERLNLEVLAEEDAEAAHNTLTSSTRHRPVDRRRLSAVLPRPWRRLARGRYRRAGSRQDRPRPDDAADRQTDGAAGGAVASAARRRGASVVELLPGDEEARGRDRRRGKSERCFKQDLCCKTVIG